MIIDADVHISPTSEGSTSIGISELLKIMDRSGVDKALTWLQPPYRREVDGANEYVYKAMKEHPDRILGFGWVDPNLGVQKAKDGVKKCIYDYGFYGVKLNGAQNVFYIDDPVLSIPVIEEIAKTGKLLAFHVGSDDYERTHPFRAGEIARKFPDLPSPEFSTCGEMVQKLFTKKGIWEDVKKNVGNAFFRSHSQVGTAIKVGNRDAGIMWNGVAHTWLDALEIVPTPYEYDEEIEVGIIGLSYSKNPKSVEEFLKFAEKNGKAVFTEFGYIK